MERTIAHLAALRAAGDACMRTAFMASSFVLDSSIRALALLLVVGNLISATASPRSAAVAWTIASSDPWAATLLGALTKG
jgi:hypothetical protein